MREIGGVPASTHYAKILSMSDEEFNEHLELYREMRKVVRSTLLEPPVIAAKKR